MALDLKAWLVEQGVPVDKVDAIVPSFAGTSFADNVEKSIGTVTNLKAKETALATAQTKLDESNERLNLEMVEWAEERAKGGTITEQMRQDMAKAQAEVTRLTTIVTTKAQELGLDPKTIIGEPPAPPAPPPAPAPNLDGYIRRDELGAYGRFQIMLATQLPRIQHEHMELTGEWLDPETITSEFESRAGDKLNRNADGTFKKPIDLRAIWEDKYQIGEKRAAKAKATHDAEIAAAEERGYSRRATEASLPGQSPVGRHSPVLRQAGDPANASKAPRPSQAAASDRISRAASALATHKYRGWQPGTAPPAGGR